MNPLLRRSARSVAALAVVVALGVASSAPVQARDVERNSERASRASASQQAQAKTTRLFAVAKSLRGPPYRFGGTTPRGFDCSGYVTYVLERVGVTGLPRNSAAIRRAVREGCPDAQEIGDRREAIHHAIHMMRDGDVVVIAGKGHEQGQIFCGVTHPFDDATVAAEALNAHA